MAVIEVLCMTAGPAMATSSIKPDEEVVFFPTSAHLDEEGTTWVIPVHGWIFEREEDSIWRTVVIEELLRCLELDPSVVERQLFRERARLFLVDNERGKKVHIQMGERVFAMNPSEPNGHFTGVFGLERKLFEGAGQNIFQHFRAVMPEGDSRRFQGMVQLLLPEGTSVISDIDDTIKISQVADKQQLLANTFLRPFRKVPGMAELYRKWAEAGAAFHYVSSSPWQLYPALSKFVAREGFPRGSFHLKSFRLKDRTFFNLFETPERSKPPVIDFILRTYPRRKFILVGDSGEKDPEVYGAIARKYPEQIIFVFIRNVSPKDHGAKRFMTAFNGLSRKRWKVFFDPRELVDIDLSVSRE